ncbi:cell division protein DamX [Pluralibacter gergoviae]
MDEFKPEDEMKPDPSDRRSGRSRQSSDRDNDRQINFDDVDLDDDRRPARGSKASDVQDEERYDADDEQVERRPRKRKKAPAAKPASRQYLMMGLGILVLLVLIIGIGSALKSPSAPSSSNQASGGERNIDLNNGGDAAANQANGAQPAPGSTPANQTQDANGQTANNQPQDVSVPPIASTPADGSQSAAAPEGQQRVEVQGDLNNALTQQQGQVDSAVANSTLPTEPATVAPIRGGSAQHQPARSTETAEAAPRTERKHSVIESKPQSKPQAVTRTEPKRTEPQKRVEQPKRSEPAAVVHTPAKVEAAKPTQTAKAAEAAKPVETAKPAATGQAKAAQPAATSTAAASTASKGTGDIAALKSASSSHYTLQLSSSSNYDNLNGWAKKENVKNYVVYQTTRNGQPWYVLVSGVYATKDDAKRAVSSLPADVQAKNPWAKPVRQVQSDLK